MVVGARLLRQLQQLHPTTRRRSRHLSGRIPFSFRRDARIAIHQVTRRCKATTVTSIRKM
jgi:hypothetical protein